MYRVPVLRYSELDVMNWLMLCYQLSVGILNVSDSEIIMLKHTAV